VNSGIIFDKQIDPINQVAATTPPVMSKAPDGEGASTLQAQSADARTKPELICVVLSPDQARLLNPLLDRHRTATKVTGLLCALTRSWSAASGATALQLQILPINRRIARLLEQAAKDTGQQ
jgi:hypothetical protein